MSRSSVEITDQEKLAFLSFGRKHGIILEGDPGVANGALVRHNFVSKAVGGAGTWDEDITEASLEAHFEQLRPHLKFYDENEKAVIEGVEASTPAEKKVLDAFWAVDRQIETSTYNVAVLIKYLRGHNMPITHENLHYAVSKTYDLLQWRHVSTFKSRISDEEKKNHKPGTFLSASDCNKSPAMYKAEAEEAASIARGEKTSQQQREANAAQVEAESLAGRTHYETQEIRKPLVADKSGNVDWTQTLRLRRLVQQGFDKARMVRTVPR
jgi:hypothetical protein